MLADALSNLSPTDPAPTIAELGGEDAILTAVPELDTALLPRLIEVLDTEDWTADGAPVAIAEEVLKRLPDVEQPVAAASSMDVLVAIGVAGQDAEFTRLLMKQLLSLVDTSLNRPELALRAGYAIRAATDLALLDVGVSAHGVLAAIENLGDVPPEMASGVARAAGRLWEHHDAAFLEQVLEDKVLPHEDAAGDALLELGLHALRTAFGADDPEAAGTALQRGVELFERARTQDEDRADAHAFSAAARAVLAFDSDFEAMSDALDELEVARADLDRYGGSESSAYRGASALRSVAGWHVLASTLRGVQAHVDEPNVLELRPAIEALVDAYTGMRLGVLADDRRGLQAFIAPTIARRVRESDVLSAGARQLASEPGVTSAAEELAAEVVRPKVTRLPACRAARSRHRLR